MRKFILFFLGCNIILICSGQAPSQINYQGIARNSVGNVLPNQAITIRLSIRDGSASGPVVYTEARTQTTNAFGLFSFGIGSPGATSVTGTVGGVNWATGNKFLQVEMDPNGGTSYTNAGTAQLLSVPYAFYASTAIPTGPAGGDLAGSYPNPTVGRIRGTNISAIAPLTNQVLQFNGTDWMPSNTTWLFNGNNIVNNNTGSVGIGGNPNSSAILDMQSTSKGLLIPRMSSVQRTGITSPGRGLFVYDTDTDSFWYYNGTNWINTAPIVGNDWLLVGNAGTNPAVNFIGTTDNQPLVIRVNNIRHGWLGNSVFFGRNAGSANTGYGNIGIGSGALLNNTTRNDLVAIGDSALLSNGVGATLPTHAINNTALGYKSLFQNTTGAQNTAAGYWSLVGNVTGSANTAFGNNALRSNIDGDNNTGIGNWTLLLNSSGDNNTAVGDNALSRNTIGSDNVSIGQGTMIENNTGSSNTAVGSNALYWNTSGYSNVAIGVRALNFNTIGSGLVAVGDSALYGNIFAPGNNEGGHYNTATGSKALFTNNSGHSNTANGYLSLYSNSTGLGNTAMGSFSLLLNNGPHNTAIGVSALRNNTIGSNNTALGSNALFNNSQGSYHTAIGSGAGTGPLATVNSTAIGSSAIVDASNKVRIGDNFVTSIGGQVGWTNFSDGRYKKDIAEDVKGLQFINLLRPVTYVVDLPALEKRTRLQLANYDYDERIKNLSKQVKRESGFIAQEVEQAAKKTGFSFSGVDAPADLNGLYGLRYSDFVVPLVKAIQEQQTIIEKQQMQINQLLERVAALEKK